MIDEKKLRDEMLCSLSDESVPNKPNKIKAIYEDRANLLNRPIYKFRRLYFIGIPALIASIAVAIIVPIATKKQTPVPNFSHNQEDIITKNDILGSDDQLSFSFNLLGNAARTLNDGHLPTEVIGNSSFITIKDLFILNSYLYTFENYLNNGFDQIYSIEYRESNPLSYQMSYPTSDTFIEFNESFKSTYSGEQNYELSGMLKYTDIENEYLVSGEKTGFLGVYSATNSLEVEPNKYLSVSFTRDVLGAQEIHLKENSNGSTLSDISVFCYSITNDKEISYYIVANFDGFDFTIKKLNDKTLSINIDSKNTSDIITVNSLYEDGVQKYEYINKNLNIDFKLKAH